MGHPELGTAAEDRGPSCLPLTLQSLLLASCMPLPPRQDGQRDPLQTCALKSPALTPLTGEGLEALPCLPRGICTHAPSAQSGLPRSLGSGTLLTKAFLDPLTYFKLSLRPGTPLTFPFTS